MLEKNIITPLHIFTTAEQAYKRDYEHGAQDALEWLHRLLPLPQEMDIAVPRLKQRFKQWLVITMGQVDK